MKPLKSMALVALTALLTPVHPAAAQEAEDPFLWLEDVEGQRAMEWVHAQNEKVMADLGSRPAYEPLLHRLADILGSEERIAYPSIAGDRLYNFWQDDEHPRGLWRRTTWSSYLGGEPDWETVLDVDALAEDEGVPWSFGGATCLPPANRLCMVALSRGGADAVELREFDRGRGRFVEGGFFLPEAKQSVAWQGPDALLVATDFGPGTMTTSGYPRVAKLWRRGRPLAGAVTLFEAEPEHVLVAVGTIETSERSYDIVFHRPSFFEGTAYLVEGEELTPLEIPADADPLVMEDQLVVYLRSPWELGGTTYPEGSVISAPLRDFLGGSRAFDVVVKPGPRTTVEGTAPTKDYLLVSVLDDVRGQLWRYRREGGGWVGERIQAPDFGSVTIRPGWADPHTNRFFFAFSSFTQPTTLYLVDEDGSAREVRRMPAMFDADGLVADQHEATSPDGTRVPYFVVHRRGMAHDGTNPTLLYGYGGFQIALTPSYDPTVGAGWLERGGVYVLANIRGGGEFGPSWWRAAQKEHRQRAYDDFIAVARDLVDQGVTSPDHLGILGGSNGGLLVGVAMTQRPDLFRAVVVVNPLLDMRRYNKLLAGASWMAEYGNPDDPADWQYIRQYSPYQNLRKDADYPVPFIFSTTRDDRVHPGHARKMAAKMLSMGHAVHYFENTEGGHGAGVTPEQRARRYALTYVYLLDRLKGDLDPAHEGFD